MSILVTGSVAFDHIMVFEDQFKNVTKRFGDLTAIDNLTRALRWISSW